MMIQMNANVNFDTEWEFHQLHKSIIEKVVLTMLLLILRNTKCMSIYQIHVYMHFYWVFTFIARGTQCLIHSVWECTISNMETFKFGLFDDVPSQYEKFKVDSVFTLISKGTQCMAMNHLKRRTKRLPFYHFHFHFHCLF